MAPPYTLGGHYAFWIQNKSVSKPPEMSQSFSSSVLLFVFLEMNLCEGILSKSGRILTYLLKLWQHLLSFPMLQGLKMQLTLLLRCGKKRWIDSVCHHNTSGISLESPPSVSSRKLNKPTIQFSLNLFWSNNLSRPFEKCAVFNCKK